VAQAFKSAVRIHRHQYFWFWYGLNLILRSFSLWLLAVCKYRGEGLGDLVTCGDIR